MRMMFHTRRSPTTIPRGELSLVDYDRHLADIYIINNDLDNFKKTVIRLAQQLEVDKFMKNIRRYFYASKRRGCSYEFRLHLVKTFIEHGLFTNMKIIENFRYTFNHISRFQCRVNIEIPLSAPTILLELCHEARAISRDDFDSAFELCVSACQVSSSIVYVRRLFSLALDNHAEKFYPDCHQT